MIKQKVTYRIFDEENEEHPIITLTIGAIDEYEYDNIEPGPINQKIVLENVPLVKYPDNRTPIQYLDANSNLDIESLMLLEETDYQIQLDIKEDIPEECIDLPFRELCEQGKDQTLQLNKWFIEEKESKHTFRGTLRFSSYVGKSCFDISISPYHIDPIPFEVRSKK